MFDFITDVSFDTEKTKDYILSIQVSLDGFSFLIFHPEEKRVVAFKTQHLKISNSNLLSRHFTEWINSEEILSRPYQKVELFIFTQNFTLIPHEFSGDDLNKDLASVLFHEIENDKILLNKLDNSHSHVVFQVPSELINAFQHFFNHDAEIFHPVTKILQATFTTERNNIAVILHSTKFFFLVIFRKGKLLLANSYQTGHHNDLIYNVLNTFQQLGVARINTHAFIESYAGQNMEIEEALKPYFEKISPFITGVNVANPEIFAGNSYFCSLLI